jgi:hypothetical protein
MIEAIRGLEDGRVNNILLTAINDGDGSQCGATYARRVALAKERFGGHILKWRVIVDECANWLERSGCVEFHSRHRKLAAIELRAYYIEHVKEGA